MESVVSYILDHAKRQPDKPAVIAQEQTITYGELSAAVRSVAAWLKALGIGRGDRVVIESAHTLSYIKLCFGIQLSRAVYVPVENGAPADRIAKIAGDIGAKLIIAGVDPACGIRFFGNGEAEKLALLTPPLENPEMPRAEDEFEILYTTGTTGKSKGVVRSNDSTTFYCLSSTEAVGMKEDARLLICTPLNHAGGAHRLDWCFVKGATAVLLNGMTNVKLFFEYLRRYRITATYLPPFAIRLILTLTGDELSQFDGQIDFIYTGSAPYPDPDREKMCRLLPRARLYVAFGGSEFGVATIYNYNTPVKRDNCIGQAVRGARVTFVDDQGAPVQATPEQPGSLCIGGPMLMLRYENEPELTAGVMRDGVLRLTDKGYMDKDGYVYFAGRADDVINIGGLKVAPVEVEDVTLGIDGIADCACTAVVSRSNTAVKLLVRMEQGRTLDQDAIIQYLKERLEPYKLPKIIKQVDSIPRTYNGKIERRKLADL